MSYVKKYIYFKEATDDWMETLNYIRKDLFESCTFIGKVFFGIVFGIIFVFAVIVGYGVITPVTALCFKTLGERNE